MDANTVIEYEAKRKLRQQDHDTFIQLVIKYGPLVGILYGISDTPGAVYTRLCKYAAIKIQRWARKRLGVIKYNRSHLYSLLLWYGQDGYVASAIKIVEGFRYREYRSKNYRQIKVNEFLTKIVR